MKLNVEPGFVVILVSKGMELPCYVASGMNGYCAAKKNVVSVVILGYLKFLSLFICLIVHCFIYFHYNPLYDNFQHAVKQKYSLYMISSSIVFHILGLIYLCLILK